MTRKYNNPAKNILDQRRAQQSRSDVSQSTLDSNMLSESALHVESTDKCPKCSNKMQLSSLAGDVPAMFCADCSVAMPVPMKE